MQRVAGWFPFVADLFWVCITDGLWLVFTIMAGSGFFCVCLVAVLFAYLFCLPAYYGNKFSYKDSI